MSALFVYFGATKILWMATQCPKKRVLPANDPLLHDFGVEILEDSQCFKDAGFSAFFKRNSDHYIKQFILVETIGSVDVWVYLHDVHVNCSAATYRAFGKLSKIEDKLLDVEYCTVLDHWMLKPFFYDNIRVLQEYERDDDVKTKRQASILKFLIYEKRCEGLTPTPDEIQRYECPGPFDLKAVCYNEDAWSKRLSYGMRLLLPEVEATFTGDQGPNFSRHQARLTGLTSDDASCYLFWGAPDITIMKTKAVVSDSDKEYVSDDQMSILQVDKQTSSGPEKVGELFAQLHMLLVQKCLRILLKKKNVDKFKSKTHVTTKGIYINKQACAILCHLTMPLSQVGCEDSRIIAMLTEESGGGLVTESQLCCLLKKLTK